MGTIAGTAITPGLGTVIGAVAGALVGAIVGVGAGFLASKTDNDATEEEAKVLDAIYEEYKKSGESAFTPEGIAKAMQTAGVEDSQLENSLLLEENSDLLRDLIYEMEANTAAIEAENKIAAQQYVHALDQTL